MNSLKKLEKFKLNDKEAKIVIGGHEHSWNPLYELGYHTGQAIAKAKEWWDSL